MTSISMTAHHQDNPSAPQVHPTPVGVQVLSTILFAAFAIPVTIVALNMFWPAGVALAVLLGWRGGFAPNPVRTTGDGMVQALAARAPEAAQRSSGNASFDAYRADMLTRLEKEQQSFEGFLDRLRDAKDKGEFDQFMDERAKRIDARRH